MLLALAKVSVLEVAFGLLLGFVLVLMFAFLMGFVLMLATEPLLMLMLETSADD